MAPRLNPAVRQKPPVSSYGVGTCPLHLVCPQLNARAEIRTQRGVDWALSTCGSQHMASLEPAIEIAAAAHAGRVDKAGQSCIVHPLRVMWRVQGGQEGVANVTKLADNAEHTDFSRIANPTKKDHARMREYEQVGALPHLSN